MALEKKLIVTKWQEESDCWQRGLTTKYSYLDSVFSSKTVSHSEVFLLEWVETVLVDDHRMYKLRDGAKTDQDRHIYMYIHQKWNMLDKDEWNPLWQRNRRLMRATHLKYSRGNFLPANRIIFCLDSKDAGWIWSHLHQKQTVKDMNQQEFLQGKIYTLYTRIVNIGQEERCEGRNNKKQVIILLKDTQGQECKLQLVDDEGSLAKLMAEGEHLIVYNPFLAPTEGTFWIGQDTVLFVVAHKDVATTLPISPSQETKADTIDMSNCLKRITITELQPRMTGVVLVGRVVQVFPCANPQFHTHARPTVESMRFGMRLVQEDGQMCDVTMIGSLGLQSFILPGHLVVLQNARTFNKNGTTVVVMDPHWNSQIHTISINRGILASPPLRTIYPLSDLPTRFNIYARVRIVAWKPCGLNGDMFGLLHKVCQRRLTHGNDGLDRCSWCNVVIDFVQDISECFVVQWTLNDGSSTLICEVLPQAAEDLVHVSVSEMKKLSLEEQKGTMDRVMLEEVEVSLSLGKEARVDLVGSVVVARCISEMLPHEI